MILFWSAGSPFGYNKPTPKKANWISGPHPVHMDIYILRESDETTFNREMKSDGKFTALAWINSNEALFKEDIWPVAAMPPIGLGGIGWLASKDMPGLCDTPLQQGFYIHEVLGHCIRGLPDGHPTDPTMNQSENLPPAERLALMNEISEKYPYLRIQYWRPGMDIHTDDAVP